MGKLSVNVQVLRNCRSSLMNQVTEVEDIILNLNTVYRQVDADWDGGASRAYLDRLEKTRNEMIAIANAIREYASAIGRLADQIEEQDRREEARLRALQALGAMNPAGTAGTIGQKAGKAIADAVSGGAAKPLQPSNLGGRLGDIGQKNRGRGK